MKPIVIILLVLLFPISFFASAQSTVKENAMQSSTGTGTYSNTFSYHSRTSTPAAFNFKDTPEWKKFKIMRAVGWSSFGCGLGLAAFGGFLAAAIAIEKGDFAGPPLIFTAVGGSLIVASVPILAIGYNYKKKAKKLALGIAFNGLSSPRFGNSYSYTPGIGLSLKF